MYTYIKQRIEKKNELCLQDSSSTRLAKCHSLFLLGKRILQQNVLQAMNLKPGCLSIKSVKPIFHFPLKELSHGNVSYF